MMDRFSVHMQYRSALFKDNSQSWYFQDLEDSRLNIIPPNNTTVDVNNTNRIITGGGTIVDNGDVVTLFEILTTSGYDPSKITMNHVNNKAQKCMMLPTDWTNVEITGYFEFMETNPNSELSIFARSGRHQMGRPCEGTFYRSNINASGRVRCDMKHWHAGGYEVLDNALNHIGDIEMMRIGFKFVVYNSANSDNVILRLYCDMVEDNTWHEMCYVIDTGENSNRFRLCGDETTKTITWGGPIIGIELRNFPINGVAIDKLSVREIDPHIPQIDLLPEPVPIDPYYVVPPTTPPSTALRASIGDDWDDDVDYPLPPWGDPGDNPGV